MPQYRESLNLRTTQTVVDILRAYPETFQGRRTWPERVFCRDPEKAEAVTLASLWKEGKPPGVSKWVTRAVKVAEWRPVQAGFRLAWGNRPAVWARSNSLEGEREIAI